MRDGLPVLIIVSGSPASGKTTLARRLAAELGLPLVARDELKEVLFETLGVADREASRRLGLASFRLIALVAERLLEARECSGLVLESNFRRGLSEASLAPLVARARGLLLHCEGDPETITRRYQQRAERGERHPGHFDLQLTDAVRNSLGTGEYEPLDLGVPVLRVNTTVASSSGTAHGYAPALDEIIAFARRV